MAMDTAALASAARAAARPRRHSRKTPAERDDGVRRAALLVGARRADVKLARLLIFGALNWSVRWCNRRRRAGLDELTDAAAARSLGRAAGAPA